VDWWDGANFVSTQGAGGGTVTNTGTLTSGALIVGGGGVDVSATTTGTGVVTALGIAVNGAGGAVLASLATVAEGRLTTESGVPVSTSDRTAQSTIYWKPCTPTGIAKSNGAIALYDGTRMVVMSITQLSL